jgi:putative ATPase
VKEASLEPRLFDDANDTSDTRADAGAASSIPLAERLRPTRWQDVVGQSHLLGPGKALRACLEAGQLHSCILWGPPGVGKTTLARLLAQAAQAHCISISGVLAGVKDIRDALDQALHRQALGQRTVVLVDEVHRFNKAQQDAFLPHVESGLFTLIGATTENPSFEVNAALLSRSVVYVLQALTHEELHTLLTRALAQTDLPPFSNEAQALLLTHADGDARRLLGTLEALTQGLQHLQTQERAPQEGITGLAPTLASTLAPIEAADLHRLLGERLRRFDKGGDAFYDQISALHKSVRGSDPDAALYWLCRMLDGGADPLYLARRLLRMACEDIGLADPRAWDIATHAVQIYERLGSPEGELALAACTVYLAVAPKSNAVYKAFKAAQAWVRQDSSRPVPMHLRNAPTRLMKDLGMGQNYRYAHDEPDAFSVGQSYLPEGMAEPRWYEPVPRGLEIQIAQKLAQLRKN